MTKKHPGKFSLHSHVLFFVFRLDKRSPKKGGEAVTGKPCGTGGPSAFLAGGTFGSISTGLGAASQRLACPPSLGRALPTWAQAPALGSWGAGGLCGLTGAPGAGTGRLPEGVSIAPTGWAKGNPSPPTQDPQRHIPAQSDPKR